jgi:hypothetical protein
MSVSCATALDISRMGDAGAHALRLVLANRGETMATDVPTRRCLTRRSFLGGAAALAARPALGRALLPVSTALVLAADISSSIDDASFALQRSGYAAALTDPRVLRAIQETAHGAIGVCYFEWASQYRQQVLVPWTRIATLDDGARVAEVLETAPRPFDGSTGLGPALRLATALLAESPFAATERVIDVSGDGPNNDGEEPDRVRDQAVALGIRVNGLAIRGGYQTFPGVITLPEYYEDNVKGGATAFVMEAEGFETFGATLVAKLRREIT